MSFRFLIFSTFVFLAGCNQYKVSHGSDAAVLSSLSLSSCLYIRNSMGQIVSWKSATPINFYVSEKVPEKWLGIIKDAAQIWVSPIGTKLVHIENDFSNSESAVNDKKNIIYWTDSGALFNYQQAQTIMRWSKNQMQDTDIMINAKDFIYYLQEPEDSKQVHFKSLLVHEFGHALGLKHTSEFISVMYPDLAFSQVRVDLAEMDQNSVKCEYK